MRQQIIEKHYDALKYKYPKIKKTLELILKNYYYPGIRKQIEIYIKKYINYNKNKLARHVLYGKLTVLIIPTRV